MVSVGGGEQWSEPVNDLPCFVQPLNSVCWLGLYFSMSWTDFNQCSVSITMLLTMMCCAYSSIITLLVSLLIRKAEGD